MTNKGPVVLTIDRETAEILLAVLSNVGGKPTGPRGKVDDVYREIQDHFDDLDSYNASDKYVLSGNVILVDKCPDEVNQTIARLGQVLSIEDSDKESIRIILRAFKADVEKGINR